MDMTSSAMWHKYTGPGICIRAIEKETALVGETTETCIDRLCSGLWGDGQMLRTIFQEAFQQIRNIFSSSLGFVFAV